jgi:hypothetical protein
MDPESAQDMAEARKKVEAMKSMDWSGGWVYSSLLQTILIADYQTCSRAHQLLRHQDEHRRRLEARRERASKLGKA